MSSTVSNSGHKSAFTPKQAAFLAAFTECGTVRGAARAAKVCPSSHYKWLADDEYSPAFENAKRLAVCHLEDAARERAIDGVRRLKFDRNGNVMIDPETKKPYVEYRYSDTVLIFLLKCLDPERFGDRQHVTHDAWDWRSKLEERGIDPDKFVDCTRRAMELYEAEQS